MKKTLNNKGEGYIDICVGIIALLTCLVLTINLYTFLTLRQDLDEVSGQLIKVATSEGCFGGEFDNRVEQLRDQLFDFDVSVSADSYYNASYRRVQLGNTMKVTVSCRTTIQGAGIFTIPITCTSTRSGISEHYWKS